MVNGQVIVEVPESPHTMEDFLRKELSEGRRRWKENDYTSGEEMQAGLSSVEPLFNIQFEWGAIIRDTPESDSKDCRECSKREALIKPVLRSRRPLRRSSSPGWSVPSGSRPP